MNLFHKIFDNISKQPLQEPIPQRLFSTPTLSIEEIPVLETSDSYYEMVTGASLATYGLPQEITDDMVGETVSFLSGGSAYYQPVDAPTDITLHEYASHPCEGVYVMQQEDRYRIFLYYNPTSVTQSNLMGLDEVYEIFGVTSPDDIAALYETDWHKDKQIGKKITDPDAIRAFYQSSTALSVCDNDAFQAKQFDSIPESEQPKAHTAFADELRVLCIETVSGFRFYVDVHPDSGWITSSLFYYPVSEEMEQWLQEYLQ